MSGPYATEHEALADAWPGQQRPDDENDRFRRHEAMLLTAAGEDLESFDLSALRAVARLDSAVVQAVRDLLLRRFEQGQQHELDPAEALGGFCAHCHTMLSVTRLWQSGRPAPPIAVSAAATAEPPTRPHTLR